MLMESENDNSDQTLDRIITVKKKIRDVARELRDWMIQGSSDNSPKLRVLYQYASTQLAKQHQQLPQFSTDLALVLFCACADSVARAPTSVVKQDDWDGIMKQILHIINSQNSNVQLDKHQVTISKYVQYCQSKGVLMDSKKRKLDDSLPNIQNQSMPGNGSHRSQQQLSQTSSQSQSQSQYQSRFEQLSPPTDDIFQLLTPTTEEHFTTSLSFNKSDSLDAKLSSTEQHHPYHQQTTVHMSSPPSSSVSSYTSTSSSAMCSYELCVSQSFNGNSYHTYRAAYFIRSILLSVTLPYRVQSIALEIFHTLAVSLLQQQELSKLNDQHQHTTARYNSIPLPCPLWTKDETSAVSVACICMACKIVSDEQEVPRKTRIIEASDRVSNHFTIFRSPIDLSTTLRRYETQIVRALSYEFNFTTIEAQIHWCSSVLSLSSEITSQAVTICHHEVFSLTNLTARYSSTLLAMVCLYLSYEPHPPLSILHSWCNRVVHSPEISAGVSTGNEIVSLAQEAKRLKNDWLPLMKQEMKLEEEREEKKRSEILTSRDDSASRGMSIVTSLLQNIG